MKTFRSVVIALLTLPFIAGSQAGGVAPNAYDTLARVLMPFVNLLAQKSRSPNRALTMTLQLEDATDLPKELAGAQVELALEYPDKLKLHGPALGEDVTVCRNGQQLWAAPGSKIEALMKAADEIKKLPPPNPKFRLAPFSLPVPEKQLVFLPVLFQVQSASQEEVAGTPCTVLDLRLMPELERSIKGVQGWSARVWVGPDGTPVRLQLDGPDTKIRVRLLDVKFQRKLPPATWEPAQDQDTVKISPSRYDQLVRALVSRK